MRRLIGDLVRCVGRWRIPMGLRIIRVLGRFAPQGRFDLPCKEFDGRELRYRTRADTRVANSLAYGRSLEPEIVELAQRLTKATSTVIDVGCNVGTFSLPLASHVSRIVAIDAVPSVIVDAKDNALLNHISNIEFVCLGVAGRAGLSTFTCAPDNDLVSSLSEDWVRQSSSRIAQFLVPTLPLATVIEALRLESVDLIKIDIEDFSGMAIRSLDDAIGKVRHIIAEDSSDLPEVIPWLKQAGFSCHQPLKDVQGLPFYTRDTWVFSQPSGG